MMYVLLARVLLTRVEVLVALVVVFLEGQKIPSVAVKIMLERFCQFQLGPLKP